MLKIVMQAYSTQKRICPSMTTHKNRQLGQNAMNSAKGLMISKKEVCPSMRLVGSTTRLRGNEAYWRSDDLKGGGMPQYVTVN